MTRNHSVPRFASRLTLTVFLLVVLALSFGIYVRAEKAIDRANQQRQASFLLADELRQSSDDLTRMVRTYVVTGDPVYKQYYQDILDIRDGRHPRPADYQNVYWDLVIAGRLPPPPASGQTAALLDLMRQATFGDAEFHQLAEAKAHSDHLTATEFAAMHLAETVGPGREAALTQARQLLHDEAYHQAKAGIMQPLYALNTLMNQRTLAAVQAAERTAALVRGIFIAFGLSVLVMLWRTWATLRETLGGSAETVRTQIIRLGQGDFSPVAPVSPGGSNSVIGWLAETRQRLRQLAQAQQEAVKRYTEAEQALRESLGRYELAIKGTTDGIWHWHVATGENFHSPRYRQLLGYAADDLPDTADGFAVIVHPDDLPHVNAAQAAHFERREPYHIELRLRTKPGDYKWFVSRGQAEWDAQGQPLRMSGSITDITERKRAESALAESERRFRRLFENAPIGLFHSVPEGRFLLVNPALTAMLGYASPEEMVSTVTNIGTQVFVDPAQRPRIMAVILKHDQWFRDEVLLRRQDDRIVIADLAGRRVLNADGQVAYLEGFVQDITERKANERLLRLTQFAMERAVDEVYYIRRNGRFQYVNDAACRALEYRREELLDMTVPEVDPLFNEERWRSHWQVLKAAGSRTIETLHRSQSGRVYPVEIHVNFVEHEGQEYICSISRDITERKRVEEELGRSRDAAQAANRAKSEFLANMSHEIRTPLNAILGFAQVLGRDPDLNAAQRRSLTTIQRGGEHLLTLINDILDMAKIEAGRMTLQTAPFDLARLLTETESLFRPRAHDRGLILTVEAAGLPQGVAGDEMKLRQVLINLIGNAIKFTQAGAVTLRVEKIGDDAIRFSVTDTGMGIAPAELARLFTPFTQTESGRSTQGGTGLGLALSSQLVRLMGGQLTADSTPGQGSCFSFTLPLPPVAGPEPATVQTGHPIVGLEPGQPICRVLIVDDLADNREPLRALLNTLNPQPPVLEFREATNGQEAVAIWAEWQPRIIFMDMRMPVLSGEAATHRIKAQMKARPAAVRSVIVALTASAFDANRDRFLACGCDEFARKPFRAEELFAILEQRAGLRFIRAAEKPLSAGRLSAEAVTTHLIVCPDQWREALKDAVRLGDFGRITALLESIRTVDAALADTLAHWAYHYDLEAFTTLCNGLG